VPEHLISPLTRLYGNSQLLLVETAPGRSPFNFKLIATFEVEGTQAAYLTASGISGPTITVSYPTTRGPQYQAMVPGNVLELTSLQT
jgi:hypothetical protein